MFPLPQLPSPPKKKFHNGTLGQVFIMLKKIKTKQSGFTANNKLENLGMFSPEVFAKKTSKWCNLNCLLKSTLRAF